MRSILAFASILLLVPEWALAQTNLDSLRNVWHDAVRPDTVRLKALSTLTWEGYLFSQPDSGFHYAELLYAEAKALKRPSYMARARNLQGISWYLRGDLARALDLYQECLRIHEEHGDQGGVIDALNNIAMIHLNQGDLARAMEDYTRCLKADEAAGNKRGIAESLNNIGVVYKQQKDMPRALDQFSRSLILGEELKDDAAIARGLHNVALVQSAMGNYDDARSTYERVLTLCERLGDNEGTALALNGLGVVADKQGDTGKALEFHARSLRLSEQLGNKRRTALSLANIGAIRYHQGDYPAAIAASTRALELAQEVTDVSLIQEASNDLYNAYKATGRSAEALAMHELMVQMKDSIQSEENRKGVMQQRFQYEYDKKEALAKAEQEKKDIRQRNIRNSLMLGLALMIAFAGVFFFQRNRIAHEKERSEELLLNILPEEVAEELKNTGAAQARHFDTATILFTDFKGFTQLSEQVTPAELVAELNTCFKAFDGIMGKYRIEKIKTIGDAYMAAGGLPDPQHGSPVDVVKAALEMQAFMAKHKAEREAAGKHAFEMRLGIHTGPVVAGIVGVKKFQYDIWGDTVNTASRMESSGEVGQVNISESTYALVKDETGLSFTPRGKVQAKGKGEMEMYFVQ